MSARIKPAEPGGSYTIDTAIEYEGTLVKKTTTKGVWTPAGAGEKPQGYCFVTTINPVTKVAESDVKVSIYPMTEGAIIKAPLIATNAEIAYGDDLMISASGAVDKLVAPAWCIGTSEDDTISANTGGYIKYRVESRYVAA